MCYIRVVSKEYKFLYKPSIDEQDQLLNDENRARSNLRPELFEILNPEGGQIQRYTKLGLSPERIERETVYTHTLRVLSLTQYLFGHKRMVDRVVETMAIHDLPEVRSRLKEKADITAVAKAASSKLDIKTENIEIEFAKKIFNPHELSLFYAFSHASDFLKGKSEKLPTKVGLISKILDQFDSDTGYSRLAIASLYDGIAPQDSGQDHGFKTFDKFSKRLDILKDGNLSDAATLCQEILNQDMLTVDRMWRQIPPNQIPPIINECLTNLPKLGQKLF